ncbi:TPA: hypothetical protein ACXDAY_002229 [Clostridium botulinum]|uniref:hypothetical protein n=1 Tax=Clostridium botulinum TaxID=1491 RepID=UPI0004AFBAC6|nr:hypothetical protein [Clostridium botulinum]APH20980.1 hypothetical protein NPD1_4141 [Clostridium botulinum]APQ71229.1 hypothetical protein RSJ8_4098 [Clostridium botulinum]AUN01478.1 hypothetical protein RSJ19_00405 [Clostridium botulinum]MBN3359206.1 hypothetical protein [Clostridium botulinum]MBN3379050.1 hypothetical protein [Clostridium botulinum]
MINLESAKIIVNYLKKNGKILYRNNVDVFGDEEIVYLYNTENDRDKHIEEMKENGWEYDIDFQKDKEGVYVDYYHMKDDIYVLRAWFNRRNDTDIVKWYKEKIKYDYYKRD